MKLFTVLDAKFINEKHFKWPRSLKLDFLLRNILNSVRRANYRSIRFRSGMNETLTFFRVMIPSDETLINILQWLNWFLLNDTAYLNSHSLLEKCRYKHNQKRE